MSTSGLSEQRPHSPDSPKVISLRAPRPSEEFYHVARRSPQIRLSKLTITLGDVAAIIIGTLIATYLNGRYFIGDSFSYAPYLVPGMVVVPAWLIALRWRRLYESRFIGRRVDEIRRLIDASLITMAILAVADYTFQATNKRAWVALVGVCSFAVLAVHRELVRRRFRARHRQGRGLRRVIVVGDNDEALAIDTMLRNDTSLGYAVGARVVQRSGYSPEDAAKLLVDDTMRAAKDANAQGVIIAVTALDASVSNHLVRALAFSGLHLQLSSSLSNISTDRLNMRPMGRVPVLYIEPVARFGWRPAAKRAFDIVGSAILLLLVAPVVGAAALAIKLTSPGPIFFSQERVGRNGSTFRVFKLRSMVPDAEAKLSLLLNQNEADGPLFKMEHDPRVTPVGRFLRKSSIDELPQLWNVLKGEMSLVGPRPALPAETEAWSGDLFDRLRVRPGMTGMWQVSGRSESSFDEYTQLDLYYVDNWSLVIDLVTLLKTIPAVLARRGAS